MWTFIELHSCTVFRTLKKPPLQTLNLLGNTGYPSLQHMGETGVRCPVTLRGRKRANETAVGTNSPTRLGTRPDSPKPSTPPRTPPPTTHHPQPTTHTPPHTHHPQPTHHAHPTQPPHCPTLPPTPYSQPPHSHPPPIPTLTLHPASPSPTLTLHSPILPPPPLLPPPYEAPNELKSTLMLSGGVHRAKSIKIDFKCLHDGKKIKSMLILSGGVQKPKSTNIDFKCFHDTLRRGHLGPESKIQIDFIPS